MTKMLYFVETTHKLPKPPCSDNVGGGCWVEGIGSNDNCSMFGEGLGKLGVQKEQDGKEPFPGTTDTIDQQHRTTFCALKHARSSYKPTIFMDSGFLVDTSLEMLEGGGGHSHLFDG